MLCKANIDRFAFLTNNKSMRSKQIIYWTTTVVLCVMMLFSGISYLTDASLIEAFQYIGFPGYFRVELGIAKVLGALVLVIPAVPSKIKEWAYVGFAITFISAAIAHISIGDPLGVVLMPLVILLVLAFSYLYSYKLREAKA
jgi:hypothetical protein